MHFTTCYGNTNTTLSSAAERQSSTLLIAVLVGMLSTI